VSELKNRGVKDVLIACCDGLQGLPEAITATWPQATVQSCVVHLVRNSLRFASKQHWAKITADLKKVYTAKTPDPYPCPGRGPCHSPASRTHHAIFVAPVVVLTRLGAIRLLAQDSRQTKPAPTCVSAGQGRFRLSQCVRPKGFEPLTS
jgi:hypothetical protein